MQEWTSQLPGPAGAAIQSLAVLAGAYLAGILVRTLVLTRLSRLALRTRGSWDDVIVEEVSRRIPLWALLVGAYVALGSWALSPQVAEAVRHALLALAVVSLTLAAAGTAGRLIEGRGTVAGTTVPLTGLTRIAVKTAIFSIGFLMILNGLGISITPILTALGVGGLAVALALQDTLSNVFAGVYLIAAGQVRIGHYIRLDSGQEGFVSDIGWRATAIRMLPNNVVLVPNARLAQAIVTNFDLPDPQLAVLVDVGVDYASDLERVERVTMTVGHEVMAEVEGGVPGFEPFVRYNTFGDSSVGFTVILRATSFVGQYTVRHEFIKRLHRRYEREGITIPFPIRTLVQRPTTVGPAAAAGLLGHTED